MDPDTAGAMVVIGAAGQLGRDLSARLPAERAVLLTRAHLNLARPETIEPALAPHRPAIVFNCAAYNLVDQAEDDAGGAFAVNAFGVRRLAEVCRDQGAVLVHFSTDYVFGLEGSRSRPYVESDAPGPTCVYGLSKLTGEYFVRQTCPKHFIIRTSGLYGRHGVGGKGGNFVQTMLGAASAARPLRVVADQVLSPTSTADLAEATLRLIESAPSGLYHLVNAGQCSWFQFAQAIFAITGVKAELAPCLTRDRHDRARRPAYSALASEHPGVPRLRPWHEALAAYLHSPPEA
jgi:dTDP-4-dehydrorhamnose reductase